MDMRNFSIVIWRVIGCTFIIHGVATAIVQFGAIATTFGQIMDEDSLYIGPVIVGILLWPVVLVAAGLIVITASRRLARLVLRGLDESYRG